MSIIRSNELSNIINGRGHNRPLRDRTSATGKVKNFNDVLDKTCLHNLPSYTNDHMTHDS